MVARRGRVEETPGTGGHPADACPYRRPFAADFHDCPAYHPAYFIPLTTGYDSMAPIWTCSNLVPGAVPVPATRYYGRCRIGDQADRLAWVETLHAKRLRGLRTLSVELAHATAAMTGELFAAKGAQLQAAPDSAEREDATTRLRELSRRWLVQLDGFLDHQGASLRTLDFPPEAIRALCDDLIDTWIAQPHSGPPEISDEALQLFPEDVRVLLRPGADLSDELAGGQ
jgi:hypothetical protein